MKSKSVSSVEGAGNDPGMRSTTNASGSDGQGQEKQVCFKGSVQMTWEGVYCIKPEDAESAKLLKRLWPKQDLVTITMHYVDTQSAS